MFNWDDLRVFLAVARMRRIADAAHALEIDPTTIARRLARLAERLDGALFETLAGERRLTERGQSLLAHAETAERAALAAIGEATGDGGRPSGHVRISVAEGFSSWVLAPRIAAFRADYPAIRLDLVTASGFLNPSKREADIAVMMARPRRGNLVAAKLGSYQLRLFAANAYLAEHGTPESAPSLAGHALIAYVPEFLYAPELDYLGEIAAGLEPAIRSTSINVQHRLVNSGAGIGVLPCFIGDGDPALVRVLDDRVRITRAFWLVVHADERRHARIEAVTRWLQQASAELR